MARPSGTRLIWLITAAGAGIAVVAFLVGVRSLSAPRHQLPFVAVCAMFAGAVMVVMRVGRGSGRRAYSPVEVPLVLGLLALQPRLLPAAWLLGGVVILGAVRRQPPVQLAFNLSGFALESVAAVLVFRAISDSLSGGPDLKSAATALATLAATEAATVIGLGWVGLAVALTEGRRPLGLGFGVTATLAASSTVLIGVVLEQTDPAMLWLLAPPLGAAALAGRNHVTLLVGGRRVRPLPGTTGQEPLDRGLDPLTGLAGRSGLEEFLAHRLSEGDGRTVACLVVVLDDEPGEGPVASTDSDQLLVVSAQRLVGCLRDGDLAARLGGRAFAVVAQVEPDQSRREASMLGQRLSIALRRPASVGGRILTVGVRVGIVLGRAADSVSDIMTAADDAVTSARTDGHGEAVITREPAGG
jgi:GGDEF domain-containing protein